MNRTPTRRPRRHRRFDPVVLERLLVDGEEITDSHGRTTIQYPTSRVLAVRLGISHTTVTQFAREHNCYDRRRYPVDVQQADSQLPLTRSYLLSIINQMLADFCQNAEKKIMQCQSIADFNKLLQLREFLSQTSE